MEFYILKKLCLLTFVVLLFPHKKSIQNKKKLIYLISRKVYKYHKSQLISLVINFCSKMDDRSRSSPASDFFVHLNCLSDSELYNNKSSCFTNTMKPPILLPFHTPYEVALSNIYFKQDFYQILADVEESAIEFVFCVLKFKADVDDSDEKVGPENIEIIEENLFDKVYPSINLRDDIKSIFNEYNKQFRYPLLQYDELNMEISYNLTRQHMYDLFKKK